MTSIEGAVARTGYHRNALDVEDERRIVEPLEVRPPLAAATPAIAASASHNPLKTRK